MASIKSLPKAVTLLVAINVLVFVSIRILYIAYGDGWLPLIALPSEWSELAGRPWTVLTYMFTQTDVWQLLFNMLWLWWLGSLLATLRGSWATVASYLTGGIAGALCFLLFNMTNHSGGILIGSSCSVLAVMVCAAILVPSYKVNLLFFGMVKLKWIVAVTLVLFAVSSGLTATSSAVAHLGGALSGLIPGVILLRRRQSKPTVHSQLSLEGDDELILNGLLDKVRRSGYASLSPTERLMLIEITKRIGK